MKIPLCSNHRYCLANHLKQPAGVSVRSFCLTRSPMHVTLSSITCSGLSMLMRTAVGTGILRACVRLVATTCMLAHTAGAAQTVDKDVAERQFDSGDVSISARVHSGVYTYRIVHDGSSTLTHFTVRTPAAFAIIVPDGWEKEIANDFLRARRTNEHASSQKSETTFMVYAIGKGSVLGTVPVQLRFASGETATIEGVWGPVLEQAYHTWLVVAGLALIIAGHTAFVIRSNRRSGTND